MDVPRQGTGRPSLQATVLGADCAISSVEPQPEAMQSRDELTHSPSPEELHTGSVDEHCSPLEQLADCTLQQQGGMTIPLGSSAEVHKMAYHVRNLHADMARY